MSRERVVVEARDLSVARIAFASRDEYLVC
jgi:hypothetical protein